MFASLLIHVLACQPAPEQPGKVDRTGEVLAVVNGANVTQGMLDSQMERMPAQMREQLKARGQTAQLKEQMVVGELLYQEALKRKLQDDPKVKNELAMAQREALFAALLESVVEERSTEEAMKKWYDDHLVQFARPQVKARHILVKDKALAESILADLKGGKANFAAVAMEKSEDKGTKAEGGELGWFEKQRMVPQFADAAFAANKGDIIGPVETKFGFHVIEVEDKRDAIPLDEAKDKIKGQLKNEIVEGYIAELKKGATITDPTTPAATVAPGAAQTDGGTLSLPATAAAPPAAPAEPAAAAPAPAAPH